MNNPTTDELIKEIKNCIKAKCIKNCNYCALDKARLQGRLDVLKRWHEQSISDGQCSCNYSDNCGLFEEISKIKQALGEKK